MREGCGVGRRGGGGKRMEEEGIGRRKNEVEVRELRMIKRRRRRKVGKEMDGREGRGSV